MTFALYAAPGTCARVPCITLEEIGADYEMRLIRFLKGQHRAPDFLAVNPKGKVPALVLPEGQVLTENVAIARYLAARFPEARLLPVTSDPVEDAAVTADLAFCAATLHPIVTRMRNPQFMASEDAFDSVRQKAIEAMKPMASVVEDRVSGGRWWYGEEWSILDAYVYWVWFRITGCGFPGQEFPGWADHARRMEDRPAVQRALAQEAAMERQLEVEGLAYRPR